MHESTLNDVLLVKASLELLNTVLKEQRMLPPRTTVLLIKAFPTRFYLVDEVYTD